MKIRQPVNPARPVSKQTILHFNSTLFSDLFVAIQICLTYQHLKANRNQTKQVF